MLYKAVKSRIHIAALGTLITVVSFIQRVNGQEARTTGTTTFKQMPVQLSTPFVWLGDSVNHQWEPHAAMLIPVKLPNCPQQFYMQFDLGAPHTLFYQAKINTIKSKYPGSVGQTDSGTISNQQFLINGIVYEVGSAALKAYGSDVIKWGNAKNNYNIIGSLGVDLLEKKVLAINHPKCRLYIGNGLPGNLKPGFTLTSFVYAQNSILLPATLQDKPTMLFFDTGSSAFELLVSKTDALALAKPGAAEVTYKVNSWGTMLTAHTYVSADSIAIAGSNLPIKKVSYMDGASDSQLLRMMKLGIGGLTGNKLFIDAILVLDMQSHKFGVLKNASWE